MTQTRNRLRNFANRVITLNAHICDVQMKTNVATFNLILKVGPCRAAVTRDHTQP